jgi:hypothetical protein
MLNRPTAQAGLILRAYIAPEGSGAGFGDGWRTVSDKLAELLLNRSAKRDRNNRPFAGKLKPVRMKNTGCNTSRDQPAVWMNQQSDTGKDSPARQPPRRLEISKNSARISQRQEAVA